MDQIRLLKKRKRKRRLKCVQSAATHHGIAAFFISTKYYSKKSYSPFFYRLRAELGYSASGLRRERFFCVTYWEFLTCKNARSPPLILKNQRRSDNAKDYKSMQILQYTSFFRKHF
ncbi:MAG TPA: hypothetical protein DEB10_13975 [Ruminococcaceae bacterium]|nr:hypothetical protein [Oscillospiraceae bacterium]